MKIPDIIAQTLLPLRLKPLDYFDPQHIPCEEISSHEVMAVTPAVSVIMLAYNHAPYIRQALDSVLAQKTNFPFEIIVAEDASTDATREIAKEYQRKHPDKIRLLHSAHNVGISINGFRASQRIRGAFCAPCECDDFWHRPDKLQIQVDFLQNHPEYSAVFSDHDTFFEVSRSTVKNVLREQGSLPGFTEISLRDPPAELLHGRFNKITRTCTALLRTSPLTPQPRSLDCAKLNMSDLIFKWNALRTGKIAILPDSLSTYRRNLPGKSSTRTNQNAARLDFLLDVVIIHGSYCQECMPEQLQSYLRFALSDILPESVGCSNPEYRTWFLKLLESFPGKRTRRERALIFWWRHPVLCRPLLALLSLKRKVYFRWHPNT